MTDRSQRIETLRSLPGKVAKLVEPFSPEQLCTPYVPGEWTIAQNVHHLADSHLNSFIRFKLILLEPQTL